MYGAADDCTIIEVLDFLYVIILHYKLYQLSKMLNDLLVEHIKMYLHQYLFQY